MNSSRGVIAMGYPRLQLLRQKDKFLDAFVQTITSFLGSRDVATVLRHAKPYRTGEDFMDEISRSIIAKYPEWHVSLQRNNLLDGHGLIIVLYREQCQVLVHPDVLASRNMEGIYHVLSLIHEANQADGVYIWHRKLDSGLRCIDVLTG